MPRGKGHPRCIECEGRGIVRAPRGCVVCKCVKGEPNRQLLSQLAQLDIGDFATDDDAWREERGLPPYAVPD